eukprot:TRINITY_DN655_c0_g1_i7.p2 TRINITY_DN655_c0_g1~~TRINITY_DN655_c0_g1_i7.p2  ORF type:complete len:121 (-),score=20.05 TRINITY_DN655_c0_g1_i7:821-1183(-)
MHHSSALLQSALCDIKGGLGCSTGSVVGRMLRAATGADCAAVHALIRELAEYEHEADSVQTTADDLRRDSNVFRFHYRQHRTHHSVVGSGVFGFTLTTTAHSHLFPPQRDPSGAHCSSRR